MSQPFSFPPPPPPPPKRDIPISDSRNDVRGGFRGRGGSRGYPSRGSSQTPRGRGTHNFLGSQRGHSDRDQRSFAPAPKRDYTTAFTGQPQHRPKAPPAVPSFDVDTTRLLSKGPFPASTEASRKRSNLLGLTPAGGAASESEEDADADEEAKLAPVSTGDGLQFEHKGQKLSLSTQAEIAAWIAERRKKFPTKAKVDAAKREAEEKKTQWEEQKRARDKIMRAKRETREQERRQERDQREKERLKEKLLAAQVAKAKSAVAQNKDDAALKARQKVDKLKLRAERAARELHKLEEQLQRGEPGVADPGEDDTVNTEKRLDDEVESDISSNFDLDNTSSSGSSESEADSDGEPEETTSKRIALDRIAPSKQAERRGSTEEPQVCRNLVKFGRCKFGKKCRFSHKMKKEKSSKTPIVPTKRKGLYHIMVEKEREEELQRALKAIVSLGEQGLLEDKHNQVMLQTDHSALRRMSLATLRTTLTLKEEVPLDEQFPRPAQAS